MRKYSKNPDPGTILASERVNQNEDSQDQKVENDNQEQ